MRGGFVFAVVMWGAAAAAQTEPCPDATHPKAQKLLHQVETDVSLTRLEKYELLIKALELDDDCHGCRMELLRWAQKSKDPHSESATEAWAAGIELLNACPDFHSDLALILGNRASEEMRFEEAEAHWEHFLRFSKDFPERISSSYAKQAEHIQATRDQMRFEREFAEFASVIPPYPIGHVNTQSQEFLPSLSPDATLLWFTRRFKEKNLGDLFETEVEMLFEARRIHADSAFAAPAPVGPPFTSGSRFGGATFSLDHREVIIGAAQPNPDNPQNIDLLYSRLESQTGKTTEPSRWTPLKPLPGSINSPDGWEAQPALSPDGQELFYAVIDGTTLQDEAGNPTMDIKRCTRNPDGTWSHPVSLPHPVNSKAHDKAPFLHPDGRTLYFSSNRKPSGGGYDLWVVRRDSTGRWGIPINLGAPVNTEGDEHGLVVANNGKEGYFSSRREGTQDLDILSFPIQPKHQAESVEIVRGKVDLSQTPDTTPVSIRIFDPTTQQSTSVSVRKDDGSFAAVVKEDALSEAVVWVEGDGIAFDAIAVTELQRGGTAMLQAKTLEPEEPFELRGIYYKSGDAAIDAASIGFLSVFAFWIQQHALYRIQVLGHTDSDGEAEANRLLSEARALNVVEALIAHGVPRERVEAIGKGESQPRASNSTPQGKAMNRRTEFVLVEQ